MQTDLKLAKRASQISAAIALAAVLTSPATAAETAAAPGATFQTQKAVVSYGDIANLSEIAFNPSRPKNWMNQLSRYIATAADRTLPAGERLIVTINDVDLAGADEMQRRGAALEDVRVVRNSTPPRIDLNFRLESADGAVVESGHRELRDANFLYVSSLRHSDQALRYEKNLIDDWMHKEFGASR
jgi:hypothetical protein